MFILFQGTILKMILVSVLDAFSVSLVYLHQCYFSIIDTIIVYINIYSLIWISLYFILFFIFWISFYIFI